MFPKGYFAGSYFPPGYFERNGAAPSGRGGSRGAAASPAIRQLISMAIAEQEHRSLIEQREGVFRLTTAIRARASENKLAFDREVERQQFHSIYSLLVAEL